MAEVEADATETFWALKGVSFEVQPGEVVGIIGHNGAGKSTLLKILSRIVEPTGGCVRLKGRVASLLEVGTGFHPELTGRENVYLNGSILGMKHAEIARQFDRIVAFAGVEKFIDTPVKRYSSGMYVRLAFAVAAHLEPEILIVDEVLAVGDSEFQKKCLGKLHEVSTEGGRTVLFVSHNMVAIQNLCSHAILMSHGRVALDGPADKVISKYLANLTTSASSTCDLREHSGRRPTAERFFTKIELIVDGRPSSDLRMGKGIDIVLGYESPRPLEDLRIGIIVRDKYGEAIVSFSPTYQDNRAIVDAPLVGSVTCRIPSLILVDDPYQIAVISADRWGDIDWIEGAATLNIQPDDVFGSGKIPNRQTGVMFLPATWAASWRGRDASNADNL
jgi:lipopolysaccharide transport system ATP-binding protein